MIDREQAEAASNALLEQSRREQRERAEKLAAARKLRLPPARWLTVGALAGMAGGASLGYFVTGDTLPWSIGGLSVGMAMGMAFDRRPGA